jgi:hypothetical protein
MHPAQDPAAVAALKNLKDIVQSEIQKYRGGQAGVRPRRRPHMNDFARLARRICGKSIGLVLGGGGARGIAHLVGDAYVAESVYGEADEATGPDSRHGRIRNSD